jgi:isocitrate lyase
MTEYDESGTTLSNGTDQLRWAGIKRTYSRADVLRLRGSLQIEYTIARKGAERLWNLLQTEPYVAALGAMTGNQAIEQVRAGLLAVYASGLQAAADANTAREMYPDPSLHPLNSVPNLVQNINKSLQRTDQIHHAEGKDAVHWFAPVVADAGVGFGGNLTVFEHMKAMIEAGAAAVHFEDALPLIKGRSNREDRVPVPSHVFVEKLIAARLAADVMSVPTLLIACTSAAARGESDSNHPEFPSKEKTSEGYSGSLGGLDGAIARALTYAPYADMLCCETVTPDLREARKFAEAIHQWFPGKLLAYNCPPSFDWIKQLDSTTIRNFNVALSGMGYRLLFVSLAGFHSLNLSMFDLARDYRETGMSAYARLQESEFELAESHGYEAVRQQRFAGTGYFDDVAETISGGVASTKARKESAEEEQFDAPEFKVGGRGDRKAAPCIGLARRNSS